MAKKPRDFSQMEYEDPVEVTLKTSGRKKRQKPKFWFAVLIDGERLHSHRIKHPTVKTTVAGDGCTVNLELSEGYLVDIAVRFGNASWTHSSPTPWAITRATLLINSDRRRVALLDEYKTVLFTQTVLSSGRTDFGQVEECDVDDIEEVLDGKIVIIDRAGGCTCSIQRIMLSGCTCGGHK